MVGTPPPQVACSSSTMRATCSACRYCPGRMRSAPTIQTAYGMPHALAWNIGTIGSTRSAFGEQQARRPVRGHRVQERRAVRVRRHPSGCRWCRSCSTSPHAARSSISGHSNPSVSAARSVVVVEHLRRGCRLDQRRDVAVADDDVVLDRLQVRGDGREQRDQVGVDDDRPVGGVVHDVGELLGEQAEVQRVAAPRPCTGSRSTPRGAPGCST